MVGGGDGVVGVGCAAVLHVQGAGVDSLGPVQAQVRAIHLKQASRTKLSF